MGRVFTFDVPAVLIGKDGAFGVIGHVVLSTKSTTKETLARAPYPDLLTP